MRSPIQWYGGKGQMVARLLSLVPAHEVYCEPFAGAASLYWAKAPAPVNILNDLDSALVDFYRVLRNPAQFAEFTRLCELTPYSREEWETCRATWEAESDPVVRVWRWFVYVRQNFNGGGRDHTKHGNGWSVTVHAHSSHTAKWTTMQRDLAAVHAHIQNAHIEHLDWRRVLDRYDTADTLFYCDPPYLLLTRQERSYRHELTTTDHVDLVARLLSLQGRVILSGYAHAVYAPLEAAGWQRIDIVTAAHTVRTRGDGAGRRTAERVETIWRNPACLADMGPLFNAPQEVAV